jgi:hypothetical protein
MGTGSAKDSQRGGFPRVRRTAAFMAVCPDVVFQAAEEYFVAQEKPTSGAAAR